MISTDERSRSERRDREVLGIEDFNDADIEAARRTQPSKAADTFNDEFALGIADVDAESTANRFEGLRGRAGAGMTTDQIMALTRGES